MLAALFCLVAVTTLVLVSTPAPAWRWLAALSAVAMGGSPALAVLFCRGPQAIRRFEWGTDGVWHLTLVDGTARQATLSGATATLGPWILLAWRAQNAGQPRSRLMFGLIEERQVGRAPFRAFKGRLRLTAARATRVSGPVAS